MSNQVTNHVRSVLNDDAQVNSEVLLTTAFLLEKWKKNQICGPEEQLAELLEAEQFDSDAMEGIRHKLIRFANRTDSPHLLSQAIGCISLYGDSRDTSLFQGWLLRHTELLLEQSHVVWSLFNALNIRGEQITDRKSLGSSDIDATLADTRSYLERVFGVKVPW